MNVAGLIFSNIHDSSVPELTAKRTMASIPFGGRYRLIDFALSNMVNSGITNVGLITHDNYRSLLDHIGNGKDWDLARRGGGLKLLPPYVTAYDNATAGKFYSTRLEAMMGAMHFISGSGADVFVLSDCDVICNMDLSRAIAEHEESGAELTVVAAKVNGETQKPDRHTFVPLSDGEGNLTDLVEYGQCEGECDICADVFIVNRLFLERTVTDAIARGGTSFYRDVIAKYVGRGKLRVYHFDGFFARINSLASYFACSMRLLGREAREKLFGGENPILTKVRNSAPTRYAKGAAVKNSLIADGCVIEGEVENCVLFRGVRIGKGAAVKNCVLMQDTVVSEGAKLNCVVTDKNVQIGADCELSGHPSIPFYIAKKTVI